MSGVPPLSLSAVLVFFRVLQFKAGLQVTQHQEQSGCSLGSSIPSELTRVASASLKLCPHKARFLSLPPGGPGSSKAQGCGPPHPVPTGDPGVGHRKTVVLVHHCQQRVGLLLSIFQRKKDLIWKSRMSASLPWKAGGWGAASLGSNRRKL